MISHSAPTVADVMAREPVVVRSDAALGDAVKLMEERHVHGLPVVDGTGALVGVLSQTDLLRARATEFLWANWPGLSVRHLMSSPAITVLGSTPLADAARKMERHHVHRLVVVAEDDERLPVGIVSTTDLVRAMAQEAVRGS